MDMQTLAEAVVKKVKQQVETDEWDAMVKTEFEHLYGTFYDEVERITHAVDVSLASFPVNSVSKVWRVQRTPERLSVHFHGKELHFVPITDASTQPGDRWTIQVMRHSEELVMRFFVQQDPRTETLRLALLAGSVVEWVTEFHLLALFERELLAD